MQPRRAFTIVELLLVVAIIATLISIVIYSLRPARDAGARTKTLNGLRQMVAGHNMYSVDNRARFMPGYVYPDHIEDGSLPLQARLEFSKEYLEPADTSSYVWRLAPYLDHHWHTVMVDYHSSAIIEAFEREFANGQYGRSTIEPDEESDLMGIATMPSIGINSVYVGGDDVHVLANDGSGVPPWEPQPVDREAATHLSEVRFPTRLIVFAPAGIEHVQAASGEGCRYNPYWKEMRGVRRGYCMMLPPFLRNASDDRTVWDMQVYRGVGHTIQRLPGEGLSEWCEAAGTIGLPLLRLATNLYPHANLDGSVGSQDINAVTVDMRRWSPFVGNEVPNLIYNEACD